MQWRLKRSFLRIPILSCVSSCFYLLLDSVQPTVDSLTCGCCLNLQICSPHYKFVASVLTRKIWKATKQTSTLFGGSRAGRGHLFLAVPVPCQDTDGSQGLSWERQAPAGYCAPVCLLSDWTSKSSVRRLWCWMPSHFLMVMANTQTCPAWVGAWRQGVISCCWHGYVVGAWSSLTFVNMCFEK